MKNEAAVVDPGAQRTAPTGGASMADDAALAGHTAPADDAVAAADLAQPDRAAARAQPHGATPHVEVQAGIAVVEPSLAPQPALEAETGLVPLPQVGSLAKPPQPTNADETPQPGALQAAASEGAAPEDDVPIDAASAVEAQDEPALQPPAKEATGAAGEARERTALGPVHDGATRPNERAQAAEKPPQVSTPREPPLGSERAAEVLRQVRMQISSQLREATIQLEPKELGRISIRISMKSGEMRAELRADRHSTLEALKSHAPELRAALERVGLTTGEAGLQFGLDDPHSRQGARHELARPPSTRITVQPPAPRALEVALARSLHDEHGVDTYA